MIKIVEDNTYVDTAYLIQTVVDGKVEEEHIIRCKQTIIEKDGAKYYLLFDRYYMLNKDVYRYINVYMNELRKSERTKEKTLVALKQLYVFLTIFNIPLKKMTYDEAAQFVTFLLGQSSKGKDYTLEFTDERSPSSVNDYLSIIRNYIKYLNIRKHPLLVKSGKKKILKIGMVARMQFGEAYRISAKTSSKHKIPKYVSLDEFKEMMKYVHKNHDKRLECIIRLMFESGLRSGEVLGLTLEDLKQEKDKNGKTVYKVVMRNRITDKEWQAAKFLMKPETKNDYRSTDYSTEGYGYTEMYISQGLYDLLLDYIEEAHEEAMENHEANWYKYTFADSVDDEFEEDENFYLFINSLGRPYSNKLLNNAVKNLFIACGVPVNSDGGKKDGLCHRFRHGFAMYQVNYNHVPQLLLKQLMRHSSIHSCEVYYNPTSSDIVKMKNDISVEVYNFIPDFSLDKED